MNHDVFISYSSKNKQTADAICHVLERNKIKCWIAPRDISIGEKYGDVIEKAIRSCKVFVVVFSKESSLSPWVESELNIAFTDRRIIMPFRIDETSLKGEMRLILNNKHWIDAYPNPTEHFAELISAVTKQTKIAGPSSSGENKQQNSASKICPNPHCKRSGLSSDTLFCPGCGTKIDVTPKKTKEEPIHVKPTFQSFTETTSNLNLEMIAVKGGTFTMGATPEQVEDCNDDEKPTHRVTLSDYYIGKYPVTQEQWYMVMGNNPSHFIGDDCPVESVCWDDVQKFIKKLNQMTGKNYRLPTEAQWEFAARGGFAGSPTKFAGSNTPSEVAFVR